MADSGKRPATAIDLFCGAGGLTRGLLDAGVNVAAGYDTDAACRFPYEHNNPRVGFCDESVTVLTARKLSRHYPKGHARILVGCAPCQTFSKYTQGIKNYSDPKWTLLRDFGRLVRESRPDIVSMENVPELQRYEIFRDFLSVLDDEGFHFNHDPNSWLVYCPDYGVPQHRRRSRARFRGPGVGRTGWGGRLGRVARMRPRESVSRLIPGSKVLIEVSGPTPVRACACGRRGHQGRARHARLRRRLLGGPYL